MDHVPSMFLSLPTEVRLMIYRYITNVPGVAYQINVEDLDPRAYRAGKRNGGLQQTAYQPKHPQNAPYPLQRQPGPRYKSQLPTIETTYRILINKSRHDHPTPNLLLVNHQIRAEALAPFYARSTLHFRSMSAVIPFLTDRRDYLGCFKYFELSLNIDPDGHSSDVHQQWTHTFATMASMVSLRLEFLKLIVKDPNRYCLDQSLRKRDHMRWIEALAKIQGLESVQSEFQLSKKESMGCGCWWHSDETYDSWAVDGKETRIYCEMKLNCYLERRMLEPAQAKARSQWLAVREGQLENKGDYVWHLS